MEILHGIKILKDNGFCFFSSTQCNFCERVGSQRIMLYATTSHTPPTLTLVKPVYILRRKCFLVSLHLAAVIAGGVCEVKYDMLCKCYVSTLITKVIVQKGAMEGGEAEADAP